jgi:thymidine phosphorylase
MEEGIMLTRLLTAVSAFVFVLGLTLSSMAGREVVTGTVDKVDAMKGVIVVKTQAGPREFNSRVPEKLKDVKPGDKVSITLQEDGTMVIEPAK